MAVQSYGHSDKSYYVNNVLLQLVLQCAIFSKLKFKKNCFSYNYNEIALLETCLDCPLKR